MCTIGPQLVAELMVRFQAAHPEVEVKIIDGGAPQMIEKLEKGDLEVAIVGVPEELPETRRLAASVMTDIVLILTWVMVFSAPVMGAGAFTRERRNGTLGFLLMTPLTEGEVVRGKLLGAGGTQKFWDSQGSDADAIDIEPVPPGVGTRGTPTGTSPARFPESAACSGPRDPSSP